MSFYNDIKNFNNQFSYNPDINNRASLSSGNKGFVISGMGGSNLVADIIMVRDPKLRILTHKNYGLPELSDSELDHYQIIISSYSGNTEEAISSFKEAVGKKMNPAVITSGGELLGLAQKHEVPYIKIPNAISQPRLALGYNLKAVLSIMGRDDLLEEVSSLADIFQPIVFEAVGKDLSDRIKGKIPIIYSSERNKGLAYIWKIKMNETGKSPAFYNLVPELNHNEMESFGLDYFSEKFYFILIKDSNDNLSIKKRMSTLEDVFRSKGLPVEALELEGDSIFQRAFSCIILADWASYYLGDNYNVDPEKVDSIEKFKKRMRD